MARWGLTPGPSACDADVIPQRHAPVTYCWPGKNVAVWLLYLYQGDGHGDIMATVWDPNSISGLVVEYIVAIDVTRVRFAADAYDQQNVTPAVACASLTSRPHATKMLHVRPVAHASLQNSK